MVEGGPGYSEMGGGGMAKISEAKTIQREGVLGIQNLGGGGGGGGGAGLRRGNFFPLSPLLDLNLFPYYNV